MEHPLQVPARHSIDLLALARALLYSEQSFEAHKEVLGAAFTKAPAEARVCALARRSVGYTSTHPQPRVHVLIRLLRTDGLFRKTFEQHTLRVAAVPLVPRMRRLPGSGSLPSLETVREVATWLRLDVHELLWFADLRDRNALPTPSPLSHYNVRLIAKRDGSVRVVEAPKQHLRHIQRRILRDILSLAPLHPAVHGFCAGRSIVSFASPHAGREAVVRLDLKDFFPSVSGPRVQALFRTLGYPEHVADLLGGLCTTTTPRQLWRQFPGDLDPEEVARLRMFYARPHLPQGAPSSPAISNLCAFRLDRRLAGFAAAAGAAYTRYADDLAFSGEAPFARSADRFAARVAAIASEEGFSVQHRKTRLMRSSVRQHLAGLTVNRRPNLPRREFDRLEAILTNCLRHGPETQNREDHADFRAHLQGRVGFAAMVNPERAKHLATLFAGITWS